MTAGLDRRRARALVSRLKQEGFESAYLDRVSARLSVEEEPTRLELELRSEIAAALGRTGAKVDWAFLELEVAARAREARPDDAEVEAAYRAAWQRAYDARLDLRIHREAVGFRRNEDLGRLYPLPPRPPKR